MKTASGPGSLKHRQVLETLRRQITEGHYPPGSKLPTETELPGLLRAGKQTVVRALNELVREGAIVRRRGDGSYVAEREAPPLIPGRHLRIGLLWFRSVLPERLYSFFQGAMTRGAIEACGVEKVLPEWPKVEERQSTRATWRSVTRGVTLEAIGESSFSRARHPNFEDIAAANLDGLITLSIIEEPFLDRLLGLGLPTVLVDFPNERYAARADQVYVDPLPGYRAAVKRFAESGCTRMHFVGSLMEAAAPSTEMPHEEVRAYQLGKRRVDPDSMLRLNAFRTAMDECGLPVPESAVAFEHVGQEEALAAGLLALPEAQRPQALVCHSIKQADGVQRCLGARGVRVLSAGAADGPYQGPALPIFIDGTELGRTAVELLLWKFQRLRRTPLRVGVPMDLAAAGAAVAESAKR
ncbi:MAG: GntR family transcriptional regulator [Planctomycetota bacterium]|nr:GntR family transcriptional regulator [Planctomycetota bacterium]